MRRSRIVRSLTLGMALVGASPAAPASGGEADVLEARAVREEGGTYRFVATVRHADEGWEHYAKAFDVVGPEGTVLATRVLHHPHVEEQPFTRSLRGVQVPEGVSRVRVRALDSVHGSGGGERTVVLPGRGGEGDAEAPEEEREAP